MGKILCWSVFRKSIMWDSYTDPRLQLMVGWRDARHFWWLSCIVEELGRLWTWKGCINSFAKIHKLHFVPNTLNWLAPWLTWCICLLLKVLKNEKASVRPDTHIVGTTKSYLKPIDITQTINAYRPRIWKNNSWLIPLRPTIKTIWFKSISDS